MTCTDHYTGLGYIPVCDEAVVLPLMADVTGTWAFMSSFNNSYQYVQFTATASQNIVVPVRLNEDYTYVAKLYKPDGSIFNNTQYCFKTMPVLPGGTALDNEGGTSENLTVGKKQLEAADGQATITAVELKNAVQLVVFVEGAVKQAGNATEDYAFDAVAGSITFTTPLIGGQRITILYFK